MRLSTIVFLAAFLALGAGPILAFDFQPAIATNSAGADFVVFAQWRTDFPEWAEPEPQLLLTCSLADWLAIGPGPGNQFIKRFEAMQRGHITCNRANVAALRAVVAAPSLQIGFCNSASAELKRRGLTLAKALQL